MSQFLDQQVTWKGPKELKGPIQWIWQRIAQVVNYNALAIDNSTFANLPTPPIKGMTMVVTDSTVNTFGSTIAGGGANTVLAWYNGAHWTVIGI